MQYSQIYPSNDPPSYHLFRGIPHYPPFVAPDSYRDSTRSWSDASRAYRYGFNGKEADKEGMGGGGSTYDYGFRIYNPNLGRFLSVDPLMNSYPWYTPYQFSGNKPIWNIDVDGLEGTPSNNSETIVDPNETCVPIVTDFPAYTLKVKARPLTYGQKADIFFLNFLGSALFTAVITTVITAVAAPYVAAAFAGIGVALMIKSVVELATGRTDFGYGRKMTSREKWAEAGSFLGGTAGGALGVRLGTAARVKIKSTSANSTNNNSSSTKPAESESGSNRGSSNNEEYGHAKRDSRFQEWYAKYPEGSLSEAINKYAPNATEGVLSKDGVKIIFTDPITKNEIIYDNEFNYFRIKIKQEDGAFRFVNPDGKQPTIPSNLNGKPQGKDASDFIQNQTHIKNTETGPPPSIPIK